MNLGLYAPYDRGEITAAAMQVAELALAWAIDVRWLSPTPVLTGIHPYWDRRVQQLCKLRDVHAWAHRCQHMLWFQAHEQHLKATRLVQPTAQKHTLVPMWQHMVKTEAYQACLYAVVIASGRATRQRLLENLYCPGSEQQIEYCAWDSGIYPVRKPLTRQHKTCRIAVPLDGYTADSHGAFVLHCLERLLSWYPQVEFTVAPAKSWPCNSRRTIKQLQAAYGARFTCLSPTNVLNHLQLFHAHDWTYLPSLRSNVGMTALLSMACGTPVITYDLNPFTEIISNGQTGVLIECGLNFNWLQAPQAEPKAQSTLEVLSEIIETPSLLQRVCHNDWNLQQRQVLFTKFWANEWGIE